MHKAAKFSKDWAHRYALWRLWDRSQGHVLFVCLNPSTADEAEDDPTVRKCMRYADRWGFGGICIANLFAYRATDPSVLKDADDPVGPRNDYWLRRLAKQSALTVAGWGNHGTLLNRASQVRSLISDLSYLKRNKSGQPSHPLYLSPSLLPKPLA